MLLDITPNGAKIQQRLLLRKGRSLRNTFLFAILSVVLLLLIGNFFNTGNSNPELNANVALVSTSTKTGTAFLVADPSGKNTNRLITAKHVVQDLAIGQNVQLSFDQAGPNIACSAKLVWMSPGKTEPVAESYLEDVAVLEVNTGDLPEELTGLSLGKSSDITIGDHVQALGYPNGEFMFTDGSIGDLKLSGKDLFKLNVNIYPGNSGGPLLNDNGEVIGINVAGMEGDFKGINLAIKIENAIQFMKSQGFNIFAK